MEKARDNVRQKKEALYKSVILEAAEHEFAEHGYEAVRIQDIAVRSGISVGTLYGVFPGKWEIYVAVHAHHVGALIAMASDITRNVTSAIGALREGSVIYTRYLAEHPSYLRMHLREGYAWTTSSQFRSGEQIEAWNSGIAMIAALFAQAVQDGDIHPGDVRLHAKMMVGMQQVLLADWVERGMQAPKASLEEGVLALFDRTFTRTREKDQGER